MLNKFIPILSAFAIFFIFPFFTPVSADFNTSTIDKGVIGVSHLAPGKKLKVMVEKGGSKYTYDLKANGETEYFPLQMGNGEYKVSILENVTGTKYSYLDTTKLHLMLQNPNIVFLNSVQNIKWDDNYRSIQYGKNLSGSQKDMGKKLDTLYHYIIQNYRYDYEKLAKLPSDYNPDIEETYREKKGICYDYSSIMAGLQRSQGLPTKLVKGYAAGVDGYHAWNEVYLNGQWVIVDTTFDAALHQGKLQYSIFKKSSDYKKINEY